MEFDGNSVIFASLNIYHKKNEMNALKRAEENENGTRKESQRALLSESTCQLTDIHISLMNEHIKYTRLPCACNHYMGVCVHDCDANNLISNHHFVFTI